MPWTLNGFEMAHGAQAKLGDDEVGILDRLRWGLYGADVHCGWREDP